MTDHLLQHFPAPPKHYPASLRETLTQFAALAEWIDDQLPPCEERAVALRKLLEAQDAAVRAARMPGG